MPAFTFNPNDLHRLNRLMFVLRRTTLDDTGGERRSRHAGEGVDFLDYRPYSRGDDVRRVDWNIYGRLRQLFIRLHEVPKQLSVTLIVDGSRSMLFGDPLTKLQQAQRIACGLGFIALRGGDRVFVLTAGGGKLARLGPVTGLRGMGPLVRGLQQAPGGGTFDLLGAVRQAPGRGLVVVLSDFLNVADCEKAMLTVLGRRSRLLLVQVFDPLDQGHGLSGNLRLRDSESGVRVDVKVDAESLAAYSQAFEEHRRKLAEFCRQRGQHYLLASTHDNYLQLVCDALRSQAVVR